MLIESGKRLQRRQVHDLAELMAIYECNYIRLRQLIPDLQRIDERTLSRVDQALDLHLRVLERSPYTTTLVLTYLFEDEQGSFPAPDIRIRIYHDARLAEVLSCGRRRGRREAEYDRNRRACSLDDKWRMNRFLQKWLGYCLRQGHRFQVPGKALCGVPSWDALMAEFGRD
ncbi:DUF1249 domain-containing protein [Thiohalobacter sp. IOR34]|uniref:DUF1249 domain-containing protein n=1 Tax=Thiohalobacter sp. IOR34 TaxID=3057176 RepID=UPI0025B18FE0|nr:DUF1249 domain-containing protein [Thiohalobacter sp. IOR34]WJW76329.1 DUF1249 domain-containing protein [Thiohalobacter sp. IOR34]